MAGFSPIRLNYPFCVICHVLLFGVLNNMKKGTSDRADIADITDIADIAKRQEWVVHLFLGQWQWREQSTCDKWSCSRHIQPELQQNRFFDTLLKVSELLFLVNIEPFLFCLIEKKNNVMHPLTGGRGVVLDSFKIVLCSCDKEDKPR